MEKHEKICFRNPDRICPECSNYREFDVAHHNFIACPQCEKLLSREEKEEYDNLSGREKIARLKRLPNTK